MAGHFLRRSIQRRPLVSLSAATVTGTLGYASFIEYQACRREHLYYNAPREERGSLNVPTLPRAYGWDAINAYWSIRPLTTAARLVEIGTELLPLMFKYVFEFKIMGAESQETLRDHARKWQQALTNLGPAWVKAGQQLSIRPDLCPPVVLDELQKLCDAVQPVSDEEAMRVLCQELGISAPEEAFDELRMVASASLGQVYKGKLKGNDDDGAEVAVKIQRPGMLRAFSMDLFLLQQWGVFMDAWTSIATHQKPYHKEFLRSYAHGSYGELDYELEAKNQIQFQHELEVRNCPVDVPKVYSDRTTRRVLTTQWIDGVRLSDSPPETIRRLIPVGVELFLCQLLDIGAFHADPHPGNLLVTPEGRLCLLDFGLCAEVDSKAREGMTQAIVHLLARDFDSLVADDAKQLGFLPQDYDTTDLKPLLQKILTGGVLEAGSNFEIRKRKFMEISNELNQVFFQYPFSVPPFFALVTRGLGLLEGIALTGDPNFDIFRASAPYATKRAMQMAIARSWTTRKNNTSSTTMATSAAYGASPSSR